MQKSMPVFILTNTLYQGGAEKQSVLLAKVLNQHFDIILIVYYGEQVDSRLLALANSYAIAIKFLYGSHIRKAIDLYKIFHKQKRAIVFSYLATTNILNAIIGTLAGIRYKIGGIRNAELDPYKMQIQRFLHNYLLSYSIFNNYSGAQLLSKKGFRSDKIKVIANGFDIDTEPKIRPSDKEIRLLTIARFVRQKDYPTAINAVKYLLDKISKENLIKIHYNIVGYGILENEIRNQISSFNLEEVISVHINPENIKDYYSISDIYLSTSLFEGTSNSLMEAMSYSLPIIATKGGDNEYIVDNEHTGLICDAGNIEQIGQALYTLATDNSKRIQFGLNGYEKLKTYYSLKIFEEKYLQFIRAL